MQSGAVNPCACKCSVWRHIKALLVWVDACSGVWWLIVFTGIAAGMRLLRGSL